MLKKINISLTVSPGLTLQNSPSCNVTQEWECDFQQMWHSEKAPAEVPSTKNKSVSFMETR